MSNVDLFNEMVAKVFADLYAQFPCRVDLNAYDLLKLEPGTDEGAHRADVFYETVVWLYESGYLRYQSAGASGDIIGAVLSAKGLEVLKLEPESVKIKTTLGERLGSAAGAVGTETLKQLGSQVISMGVKHFGGG